MVMLSDFHSVSHSEPSQSVVADMLADMEVDDMVADIKVNMVADIEVDMVSYMEAEKMTRLTWKWTWRLTRMLSWSRGLVNWAKSFST